MIKAVIFFALVSYANAKAAIGVPVATNVAFGNYGGVAPAGLVRGGALRAGPLRAAGQVVGGQVVAGQVVGRQVAAGQIVTGQVGVGGVAPARLAYAAPAAAAGIAPIAVAGPAYNYAVPAYGLAYSTGPIGKVAVAAPVVKTAAVVSAPAVIAQIEPFAHPLYNFGYSVSDGITGDRKNQVEYRNGDVVKGQYSLVEPDGNIRTVTYSADGINGFSANVVHTGPTVHRGAFLTNVITPVAAVAPVVAPVAVKAAAVVAPVAVKAVPVVKA